MAEPLLALDAVTVDLLVRLATGFFRRGLLTLLHHDTLDLFLFIEKVRDIKERIALQSDVHER